jgi:simple sugar transport system permease protein
VTGDAATAVERSRAGRAKAAALHTGLIAAAIAVALALASLLLTVTDATPWDVTSAMLRGSLGSSSSVVTTLTHTAPILVVAIGACIAGRAGLMNIGQEGQLLIGALAAVVVGLYVPGPRWVIVPLVLIGGALGGALWSVGPAVARYSRGVHEVISTLLLNFLAIQLVSWVVNRSYLLQETLPPGAHTSPSPQTDRLPEASWLPVVTSGRGYRLTAGIVIALVLAVVFGFLVRRTAWGFRIRMFGFSPRVARRTGIRTGRFGATMLVTSGAFAGLAGAILLSGTALRVNPGLANNYGWEGLLVALVAGYEIPVAVAVAVLFGALRAGGGVLASTGVSPAIVGVVQAVIVLAVTLPTLWIRRIGVHRERQQALNAESAAVDEAMPATARFVAMAKAAR